MASKILNDFGMMVGKTIASTSVLKENITYTRYRIVFSDGTRIFINVMKESQKGRVERRAAKLAAKR